MLRGFPCDCKVALVVRLKDTEETVSICPRYRTVLKLVTWSWHQVCHSAVLLGWIILFASYVSCLMSKEEGLSCLLIS